MRLLDERLVALGLIAFLTACSGRGEEKPFATTAVPVQGPEADYPMVLGDAFSVEGKLYTPADTLNYDAVGYAGADASGGMAISASHRTLPLPSYVEVTSLETGRTILVRVERRGPMTGSHLIALSRGALEQLGGQEATPVRVRRVNPPEQERAFLRRGEKAAERMETPMSLVAVLKRKLPPQAGTPAPYLPAEAPAPAAPPASYALPASPPPPSSQPVPAITEKSGKTGSFVVQAGAFSSRTSANKVAARINGSVVSSGKLHAVRTGPFGNRGLAEASLAKVKLAGYSDARIFSAE